MGVGWNTNQIFHICVNFQAHNALNQHYQIWTKGFASKNAKCNRRKTK